MVLLAGGVDTTDLADNPLYDIQGNGGEFGLGTSFGNPTYVAPTPVAQPSSFSVPIKPKTVSPAVAAPATAPAVQAPAPVSLPAVPAAPKAAATQAIPAPISLTPLAQNQTTAPTIATGSSVSSAANPYAASLSSYQVPSNPLLYAQIAAQAQGAPVTPSAGAAPTLTAGGSAPLQGSVQAFGVPGAGGVGGAAQGIGNMPPTTAQPGPISGPAPFSGLIASAANGTQQGNGSANRGNLLAQSPTAGQALQAPPPPAAANLVPPPPAITPTPQQMAAVMPPTGNPNELKLDASIAGVLTYMQNNLNRSLNNADNFQRWVKDGQAKLDKASKQFLASQVLGPQKEVELYEKPNASGLSLLELADESLKGVLQARANMHWIASPEGRAHFEAQAQHRLQFYKDANVLEPGASKIERLQHRDIDANINYAMVNMAPQLQALAYDTEQKHEVNELAQSQSILNGYHKALVDRATAWANAYDAITKRQNLFWSEIDKARESEAHLNSEINSAIKTWSDIQRVEQDAEFRNATLQMAAQANVIAATKNANDITTKRQQLVETNLNNAQNQLDKLLHPAKPVPKNLQPQVEEQIIKLKGKIAALEQESK